MERQGHGGGEATRKQAGGVAACSEAGPFAVYSEAGLSCPEAGPFEGGGVTMAPTALGREARGGACERVLAAVLKVQGYLTENATLYDPTVGLCIGP